MKGDSSNPGLADPLAFSAFDGDDETKIHVIVETPKGSRNKYAFDAELKNLPAQESAAGGNGLPV